MNATDCFGKDSRNDSGYAVMTYCALSLRIEQSNLSLINNRYSLIRDKLGYEKACKTKKFLYSNTIREIMYVKPDGTVVEIISLDDLKPSAAKHTKVYTENVK